MLLKAFMPWFGGAPNLRLQPKGHGRMLIAKGLIGGLIQLALSGAFLMVPAGLVPGGTWY